MSNIFIVILLKDIFGLIDYLQMEPYNDFDTWKHILYNPYVKGNTEPMYNFLSKIMWRTSKKSVLDQVSLNYLGKLIKDFLKCGFQINIPQQTHELHMLEFSAVEKFFYSREHEVCAREFLHIAAKYNSDLHLERMDKTDLKNVRKRYLDLYNIIVYFSFSLWVLFYH